MIINHNISALNTYRQLTVNNNASSKSLEKLSSGYRINRAGDDAAGLAISEKMRGQIRGLNMASKNAQDGISLIQTAEGALNETHSILQRMRELAVQASNGTNTDADRAELQKEIEQLKSEIDRISTDTEFNTKKLLDGSVGNTVKFSDATNEAKLLGAVVVNDNIAAGTYTIKIAKDGSEPLASVAIDEGSGNNGTGASSVVFDDTVKMGTYILELESTGTNVYRAILKDSNGNKLQIQENVTLNNAYGQGDAELSIGGIKFTWVGASGTGDPSTVAEGETVVNVTGTFNVTVTDAEGNVVTETVSGNKSGTVKVAGLEISFDSSVAENESKASVSINAVLFQIGANAGQYTKLGISDMSSKALKVDGIDLSTAESASEAITTIDQAIQSVSSERAKLGAIQNRLEHTINNLGTSAENLTAAESRIRDVDMAKEMMEFTKNSILQQAAQAMLAQANQMPQGVLQLLR